MESKFAAPIEIAISLALGTLLAAPCPAQQSANSFDFATASFGDLETVATTKVDQALGAPTEAGIACHGEGAQLSFDVNNIGQVTNLILKFLGPQEDEGSRYEITLLGDHLWLYIDGQRLEYAILRSHGARFTNVTYPVSPSDSAEILPIFTGYRAVRTNEGEPWLPLSRFYERLISAKRVEWSFKSRNWNDVDNRIPENRMPEHWQTTRYPIGTSKLRDAVYWCTRQVLSDAARILPDRLKEGKLP